MRPLRFRAWLPNQKIMANVHCIYFDESGNVESVVVTRGNPLPRDEQPDTYVEQYGRYPASWVQLSQSTGLKDKNGAEIFEGDRVERLGPFSGQKTGAIETVQWLEDTGGWVPFVATEIFNPSVSTDWEIVGHIYEGQEVSSDLQMPTAFL